MKLFVFLIISIIVSACTSAITDSNDKSSNILGNFEVQFVYGEKPINTITFAIQQNSLSFKGCNLISGPYTYDPATLYWQFNTYSSTKIYCIIDQDFEVIEALRNAGIAYRRGSFVLFQDKSGTTTLKLKEVQRCPGNSDLIGYYQVIIADGITLTTSITLTIDEKNVGFSGCNVGGGQYMYNVRTCSWSVGTIIQTLRACTPDDQDGLVVSSLKNANFVYRIGQFIIFDGIGQKQLMKAKYISQSPITP